MTVFSELWVCFDPPPGDPPPNTLVLSFMAPRIEAGMEERWGAQIISGRNLIQQIRSRARAEYVAVIARIGSSPCVNGRTLRQALLGSYSRWWLLGATEKDCVWDGDTIYITILRAIAVQAAKERYGIERTRFYGAAPALSGGFCPDGGGARGAIGDMARAVGMGLASRFVLIVEYLRLWWTLRNLPSPPAQHRDVLLQAYWDWSVRPGADGRLTDRYFTDLPAQLVCRGLSVGWLASCELSSEVWQRGRRRRDVLAASCTHPQITLLERYLTPADIARVALNLRDPLRVTRFVIHPRFRNLCRIGDFDLYPLIRMQLLRAAWGATFCRLQLVATATTRACEQLGPRMVLAFMELFLRSRALYAGIRAWSSCARVWAAQHAGYSRDKTLGVFDRDIEIRGTPDGCPIPAPDGIFVMGDLSRRIWEENGLGSGRVVQTGGLRYQSVRIDSRVEQPPRPGLAVLLVGGMNEAAEVDLCDAALGAGAGVDSVRLSWRDHPNYRFSQHAAFDRFRGSISVTSRSLDEDLGTADLVLFTHAGVAEEALLLGIPTWQWLWPGFNTSPFLDVPVIPSFTSVRALSRELQSFLRDPAPYQPTAATQQRVLHECFGTDPAGASVRIADAIQLMIGAEADAPT